MTHDKREEPNNTSGASGKARRSDSERVLSFAPLTEEKLWAYALDILDPEEQDWILARTALDPEAQEALTEMRKAISLSDTVSPPALAAAGTARLRISEKLEALRQYFGFAAAAVVDMGDRLVSASVDWASGETDVAAVPVTLGSESDEPGGRGAQRIDKQGPAGLSVSAIRRPSGQIDLDVRVSEPPMEGEVRLLQVVMEHGKVEGEQETYLDQPLRNGRAVLKGCPHGVFKIIAPHDRHMVLCLESGEP
ncbi:MAG: anti-sigma factor family protein [Planctomycetota bacterium]